MKAPIIALFYVLVALNQGRGISSLPHGLSSRLPQQAEQGESVTVDISATNIILVNVPQSDNAPETGLNAVLDILEKLNGRVSELASQLASEVDSDAEPRKSSSEDQSNSSEDSASQESSEETERHPEAEITPETAEESTEQQSSPEESEKPAENDGSSEDSQLKAESKAEESQETNKEVSEEKVAPTKTLELENSHPINTEESKESADPKNEKVVESEASEPENPKTKEATVTEKSAQQSDGPDSTTETSSNEDDNSEPIEIVHDKRTGKVNLQITPGILESILKSLAKSKKLKI